MPAPVPARTKRVYFVGAGLSKALKLPNTAELLTAVFELARSSRRWGETERLPVRVREAYGFFYPDAENRHYRPDVVDFFSALRTYIDVGSGFPGAFHDAPELYRSLKFAIAQVLIERTRDADGRLAKGHAYLERVVQPGNVVVTSNWDLLVERYAQLHDVPVRLRFAGAKESDLVLLKLHGSIDWCSSRRRSRRYTDAAYAAMNERLFGYGYRVRLPPRSSDALVRIRALERWSTAWSRVSSRATDLHMVTMARGKAGDLGPLQDVWRDAYSALSRARRLEIVGYSMPPDDIEIRTLLRASIRRGEGPDSIRIRNPSPDVHERIWRYLDRRAASDYRAVDSA